MKYLYLLFIIFSFSSLCAMEKQSLDIYEDGVLRQKHLPFHYFQAKPNDRFVPVFEGGFAEVDLQDERNLVVVIGPLYHQTALAITDGERLLAVNHYKFNKRESLKALIKERGFDISQENSSNVCGRLFRTLQVTNESQINRLLENNEHPKKFKALGKYVGNILHTHSVTGSCLPIIERNGISMINAHTYGVYALAPFFVAVRADDAFEVDEHAHKKSIKFYSIDPCKENVLMLDNHLLGLDKSFVADDVEPSLLQKWLKTHDIENDWEDEGEKIVAYYPEEMPPFSIGAHWTIYEELLELMRDRGYSDNFKKERTWLLKHAEKNLNKLAYYQCVESKNLKHKCSCCQDY
jgi:hypothetical protein